MIQTDDEYEGEQTSGMWFCFSSKGANSIYWDPNIGVYTTPLSSTSSSSSSSNGGLSSNAVSGIVAAAIISCIVVGVFCYIGIKFNSNKNANHIKDAETQQLTKL